MDHARLDVPIAVRISDRLCAEIERAAARQGLHRATYIRNALQIIVAAERACQPRKDLAHV